MIPKFLTPLRRVASFLFINALLAHTAWATPATADSLRKYFVVVDSKALAARSVDVLSAAKAREWQNETDPARKAKMMAQFDRTDAMVRSQITWEAIEPGVIKTLQGQLQEEEVLALIAYGQSPSGQVYFQKFAPALVNALPRLMAYMSQRVDDISDRLDGKKTARRQVFQKPAKGSKEALAYTLMFEMPGAQQEFKTRMAGINTSMLAGVKMLGGDENAAMNAQAKALATALQREIKFEDIVGFQSRMILDSVTEAELTQLIADHRKPELRQLLLKQRQAERDAANSALMLILQKLLPKLMGELAPESDQAVPPENVQK